MQVRRSRCRRAFRRSHGVQHAGRATPRPVRATRRCRRRRRCRRWRSPRRRPASLPVDRRSSSPRWPRLSNGFVENRRRGATWASDNTGVATVSSSGMLTVGNEGQATISATVDGQRGTLQVRVQYAFRTPDPPAGPASAEARTSPRSSCNSSTSGPISWPGPASRSPAATGRGSTWSSSWIVCA